MMQDTPGPRLVKHVELATTALTRAESFPGTMGVMVMAACAKFLRIVAAVSLAFASQTVSAGTILYQPGTDGIRDIWTTSYYSFDGVNPNPGGGLNDNRLIVGGYGDTYQSLIEFNVSALPRYATNVQLVLTSRTDVPPGAGPPYLNADRVTSSWNWETEGTGADNERLWWADRPDSVTFSEALYPPSPGGEFRLDITSLYNGWQDGTFENHGILLRPSNTTNNFIFFNSSESSDFSMTPKLEITTASTNTAALVDAWANAYQFADSNPTPTQQWKTLQDCVADSSCDVDAAYSEYQAYTSQGIQNAYDAAVASEGLVSETGVDPSNNIEVIAFVATHFSELIDNFVELVNLLTETLISSDNKFMESSFNKSGESSFQLNGAIPQMATNITEINGIGYDVNIDGLSGQYYNLVLDLEGAPDYFSNLKEGQGFVTDFDIGNGSRAVGSATFTYLGTEATAGKARINLVGIQKSAVPEPSTWLQFILGFGAIGLVTRARRRNMAKPT